MTPSAFFTMVGLLVLGVVLVALGRRGRRINDHPICSQCQFDLQGVYPGGITCPECGAGLKREGWVRIGARRRLYPVIVLGVLLAAAPVAPIALYLYSAVTGTNLNTYKPLGLLLWEARHTSGPMRQGIADEVHDRLMAKKLSKDQTVAAVRTALDLQADLNRPWIDAWGAVIEWARLDGSLTKEQAQGYLRNAPVLSLDQRPRVRAGDYLPVIVKVKESRVAPDAQLMATLDIKSATLGRATLKTKSPGGESGAGLSTLFNLVSTDPESTGQQIVYLVGSKNRMGWSPGENGAAWVIRIPKDAPPGPQQFQIDVRCYTHDWPTGVFTWPRPDSLKPDDYRVITLTGTVEVVAPEAAPIELIQPTPQLEQELADALHPQQAMLQETGLPFGSSRMLTLQFAVAKPPVPISFDVVARSGEKEWAMGVLTSGRGPADDRFQGMAFNWGQEGLRMLNAQVGKLAGDKVDLIFKPNARAARRTIDLTRIYNGEIVIKDVEVQDLGGIPTRTRRSKSASKTDDSTDGDKPSGDEKKPSPDTTDKPNSAN